LGDSMDTMEITPSTATTSSTAMKSGKKANNKNKDTAAAPVKDWKQQQQDIRRYIVQFFLAFLSLLSLPAVCSPSP